MPELGRWTQVDPLADKAHDLTPYRYGFNNPIRVTDPDGRFEKDPYTVDLGYGHTVSSTHLTGANTRSIAPGGFYTAGGNGEGEGSPNRENTTTEKLNTDPGKKRIEKAKELEGKWVYGQKRGEGNELIFEDNYCDCSEFVLRVLKLTDPEVYEYLVDYNAFGEAMGNTSTILNGIKELKGVIRTSNPRVGDIALWTGHTEFVETVDGTYFTMFGAGGDSYVPRSVGQGWLKVGDSRLDSSWSGDFLEFWTPPQFSPHILAPVMIRDTQIPLKKGPLPVSNSQF
jgi:hypothetical protein